MLLHGSHRRGLLVEAEVLQGRRDGDDHPGGCWPKSRWNGFPKGDEALLGSPKCSVEGWRRPQGIDRVSEQHDWVVGVGLRFSSRRGSANQLSTSCDQIESDLIEQLLQCAYIAHQMQ